MRKYFCGDCGKECKRDLLTVKRVVFLEMGMGGRILKSRVKVWLCPQCLTTDPDWHQPAFAGKAVSNG